MDKPLIITGCTSTGKSMLALELSKIRSSKIVNADAMQVYNCWRILSARPNEADNLTVPHKLYGHKDFNFNYSVGTWLKEIKEELNNFDKRRPIIVGGTGLYLSCLLNGLTSIPRISMTVKNESKQLASSNPKFMKDYLYQYDRKTYNYIDVNNSVRVARAYEVLKETGIGFRTWLEKKTDPVLKIEDCDLLILNAETDWLNNRINVRFNSMLANGAIEEVRKIYESGWDSNLPAAKAIGANEIIDYLRGKKDIRGSKSIRYN